MLDWLDSGSRRRAAGVRSLGARSFGVRSFGARSFGGWRIPVAAWLVAIAVAVLFAGAHGVALRNTVSPRASILAGAVIPHHDPAFPGPDEIAASDWLERAKAEAYTGW